MYAPHGGRIEAVTQLSPTCCFLKRRSCFVAIDSSLASRRLASRFTSPPDLLAIVVRVPAARVDRADVTDVHGVDLLERAILGLDDEEEYDDDEGRAASSKDEAVQVVDRIGDETRAEYSR